LIRIPLTTCSALIAGHPASTVPLFPIWMSLSPRTRIAAAAFFARSAAVSRLRAVGEILSVLAVHRVPHVHREIWHRLAEVGARNRMTGSSTLAHRIAGALWIGSRWLIIRVHGDATREAIETRG
jgi:hypothetical protein